MSDGPHSIVQKFFIMYLGTRENELEIRVWPGQRVQVNEGRTHVVDVCLTSRDYPLERVIRYVPIVCIEIVAPEDGMSDVHQRVEDYVKMGVPTVWVVDPHRRRIFQTDGASPQQVKELTIPGKDISIGIDQVFEELDGLIRDSPLP